MIRILKNAAQSFLGKIYRSDYPRLIRWGAVERPHYAYIVYSAADLAKRLGINHISAIEFGVAGGRGLLNLEHHAQRVQKLTGIQIDVYGFDTGEGLPAPLDHRDIPYVWQANQFKMDQGALKSRLKCANLVLGNVSDTISSFVEHWSPAPVGAIAFDLDYYSSTVDALRIFDLPSEYLLPRVFCYFDDVFSSDLGHVGPAVGVPLAIDEFNRAGRSRILSPLTHLEFRYRPSRMWHRQIYSFADFKHPFANTYVVGGDRQLAI